MRILGWWIIIAFSFTLGGAVNQTWAHDKNKNSKKGATQAIDSEKKELKQLKNKLKAQKRKRKAADKKEKSILSTLDQMDRRLTTRKRELNAVNKKLKVRTQSITKLETDIKALKEEVNSKKDRVRSRVRTLYQESRMNALRILFASDDYYDFMKRYYYLTWISQTESELISNYRGTLVRLGEKEEKMKTAQEELLGHRQEVASKLDEIRSGKRKKSRLLVSVRKDKVMHEQAIDELEESAGRVTALINELEKKRKKSRASVGFYRQKGKMSWPAVGKVVGFFGRQRHQKFDTLVNRKGIEIQSKVGQPIRAVYKGKVVYADWFRGFGLLVIMDHGDEFYSLYAHAAKLLTRVGEEVRTQQIIGEIGDTGLSGEPNLYFEIRQGSKPINPLVWLK